MIRRSITLAGVALLICAVSGCGGSGGTGAGDSSKGVRMQVADDATVAFKVWFKAGSQDDPVGKEGLAYVTGELLAGGGTSENTLPEILQKLYPLAASYGVRVDREMTVFTGRTHVDNVDKFFELFTDSYLKPGFAADDFERIRDDAVNAIEKSLRYNSDEDLGKAALEQFVFDGTPHEYPAMGTVSGLKSLTLDDVKAFYASHYTGANAEVAIGGGFDETLARRFEGSLDSLPEGPAPEATPAPVPAEFEGRHVLLVSKPDADASISFGFPIDVRRGDREFYALWVANSWLGEHRNSSSHLYQVIREARGMNYGDYSYIEAFPEGGQRQVPPQHVGRRRQMFQIWIRTLPNTDAHFAIRAAVRELESLVENGMSAEDFELTRSFLTRYVLHFAETNTERLAYALDDRFYGVDGSGHLARFREVLPSLTVEEVNAAVKKHLDPEHMKFAIITGAAPELKQALAEETPSPKSYGQIEKPDEILEEDKIIAGYALNIPAENIAITPVESMFEER
ncbi:peptidase M16 [Acidobacteria bacterium Mor1]|nr:peptidase M16 [Acidobacteria bacterium Mor1]